MGGGKKNKSLTQMTKTKAPKEPKQKDKSDIQASTKKNLGIVMPDVNNKKVVAELKGLKVLTPSVVASKYNIRVSLAKTFL